MNGILFTIIVFTVLWTDRILDNLKFARRAFKWSFVLEQSNVSVETHEKYKYRFRENIMNSQYRP